MACFTPLEGRPEVQMWWSMAMAAPMGTAFVGPSGRALVLTGTDVSAEVFMDVAVVDVHQTFENPFHDVLDATYQFPLPVGANVRELVITCGGGAFHGVIERRVVRPLEPGSLIEPESPLFVQEVPVCPNSAVEVELQYVEDLRVGDGIHTFGFPTTVGFRHDPSHGLRSGRAREALALELGVHAGGPVVFIDSEGATVDGARLALTQPARANADVVIQWQVPADAPRLTSLTAKDAQGSAYVGLTLQPPVPDAVPAALPRELVFVLDTTCSMRGAPVQDGVTAIEAGLAGLREGDTFDLLRFSDEVDVAFPEPVPSTERSREDARTWLAAAGEAVTDPSWNHDSVADLVQALVRALDLPGDPAAMRIVVLLTDAYVQADPHLLRIVDEHRTPNTRIFVLAVGHYPNRSLIDGLVDRGRGAALVQAPEAPIADTIRALVQRIDRPVLTDPWIDWGSLDVELTGPVVDLFVGQPLHIVGRVVGGTHSEVVVHGVIAGEPWSASVDVDLTTTSTDSSLPVIWARGRIAVLEQDPFGANEEQVAALALQHHLVGAHTFMKVDRDAARERVPTAMQSLLWPEYDDELEPGRLYLWNGPFASRVGAVAPAYYAWGGRFGHLGIAIPVDPKAPAHTNRGWVSGSVVGPLSSTAVREAIQPHTQDLKACYWRQLAKDPTLAGILEVGFTIRPNGSVRSVGLTRDDLDRPALARCILARFRQTRFPKPAGGGEVRVTYPMVLGVQ